MKKLSILSLILPFLIGCSEYTKIEQDVNLQSRIHCTYNVSSYLWIKKGFPGCLVDIGTNEKSYYSYGLKASEVETIKTKHRKNLQPYREALEKCLKDENRRCKKP